MMRKREAKARVKSDLIRGHFEMTSHALERAWERGATIADLQEIGRTMDLFQWQSDHETWKVRGKNCANKTLVIAVKIEEKTIVVTVLE